MRLSVLCCAVASAIGCTEPVTALKSSDSADPARRAGKVGPATRISAPERDYLLEVTAVAAHRSPIGDLRAIDLHADDVALRFWAGYGLVGTSGLVIVRRSGVWSAQRADMKPCYLTIPNSVGDSLSAASVERYERLTYERCQDFLVGEGGRFFREEKLVLTKLAIPADMSALWNTAMQSGLFELPIGVHRNWLMVDGHSFVIEVRRGEEYRATIIACVGKPENEVDVRVRLLGNMFQAAFPKAWGLSCG